MTSRPLVILLVEDDDGIRQIEKDYLVAAGFQVLEATDGQTALDRFETTPVALAILDLNLPVLDGITVCRQIRLVSAIPILMITAKTSEIDELVGLDVGADDYLKKPFSPKVMVARVKTLLKRPDLSQTQAPLSLGDVTLDIERHQITKRGRPVNLTATQFNMLLLMAKHPGKVFDRETLMTQGYGRVLPPDIYDRTIDTHIKNIRQAIETQPQKPKLILTVRGYGYKAAVATHV